MNDNQQRLVETLSRFPDQTSVALAKMAMLLLFSDLIGDGRDRPILNSMTYDLPDGSLSFTRDDFEKAFLNTLSQNPETENYGIGPETYAYVSKLSDSFTNQTPTPEFTETASTTLDKIRREELEEFSQKAKKSGSLAETMAKQKEKVQIWEKKQKKNKTEVSKDNGTETEPIKEESNAEISKPDTVFIAPTPEFKPREINLNPKEQEELQVIKNVFNKEGQDNFRKDVEEKVKKEIAIRLTPPEISKEEIDTSANITATSLTEIVSSLPDEIPATIFVENTTTPLTALTTSEITASIAGVNEFASDTVSVSSQVNSLLENTSTLVSPVFAPFYSQVKTDDSKDFQVSEKPSSKDIVKVEIQKLQEYAQIKNMIWEKAREMGATPSETDIEKLTIRLRGQTRAYQYVTHAAKGLWGTKEKTTSSDWGGLNIIQNNATSLLKSKYGLSVKIGGEGADKALQIMIGNRNLTAIGGKVSQLATKVTSKVTAVSAKIPSQAAFKAGVSKTVAAGITKIGAKLGIQALTQVVATTIAPIIANILAWIGTELISKISVWVKKHWKGFAVGLGGLIGLGALALHSLPLGFLSGGLFAGALGPRAILRHTRFGLNFFLSSFLRTVLNIGLTVIIIIVSTPLLVAFILFIINNGAYMVPPSQNVVEMGIDPNNPGSGGTITCTTDKTPTTVENNTKSDIASRAWEITTDLYQGFWCFWNRSPGDFPGDTTDYPPSYPELFNEKLYAQNPNPTREEVSNCSNCLFWCTWLVQKAYRETGNNILLTLWSPTMKQDFINRGKFIEAKDVTPFSILQGSVIFFRVESGPPRTNHVGIVHTVNLDYVSFVQSNAGLKNDIIPFEPSGNGLQNMEGIIVEGIGLP